MSTDCGIQGDATTVRAKSRSVHGLGLACEGEGKRDSALTWPRSQGPFVLGITLKLKPGKKDEWLSHWRTLADWVKVHEPDTLAYEASVLEKDPDTIFVYERCVRAT
jgi:hypothetical protein